MALSHVLVSPIADFTGTVTVFNSAGVTVTANATEIVRPSDWNSAHNQYVTLGGNTSGASTLSGTNIVYQGGNNVTLSANGQTIVFSGPNTAAQSVQPAVNLAAGTQTATSGTIVFANSNGVTFGMSGSTQVTASVETSYAASNHSHGNPTLNLTNLSGTTASNSAGFTLSLSANVAGGAQTGISGVGVSDTTYTSGSVIWSGQNNITVGSSVNGASQYVRLSVGNYITTARASNDAIGLNTAITQNGVSMTANSSGLSLNFPAFLTTAAVSNHSHGVSFTSGSVAFQTLSFTNSNGISFNSGTQGIFGSHNAITTGRASNDAIGLNTALTANGVSWTVNSSGLSLNVPAFLTTAAQSNHSHGNPTLALTNLTGTTASASNGLTISLSAAAPGGGGMGISAGTQSVSTGTMVFSNSNGITFGMSGSSHITASYNSTQFAGLGTTFQGNNASGSMTLNSAGLNLSVSVAAPGAAAENNWVHLLGANTAGNTTASGSTVGFSGVNMTLSGTNASQVVFSVPATSSLVGASGISISSAGSTITAYDGVMLSFWPTIPQPIASSSMVSGTTGATGGSFQTTAYLYVSPMVLDRNLTFGEVELAISNGALSAGTGSVTFGHVLGVYSLNGGTALSLVSSFQFNVHHSQSSVTAITNRAWWGSNSTSNSTGITGNSSASITGARQIKLYDSTGSFSAGNYWVAHGMTMRSSSVNVMVSFQTGLFLSASQSQIPIAYYGASTTAPTMRFIGSVSTTQNNANSLVFVMPTSIATTAITNSGGTSQHRFNVPRFYV